MNSTHFIRGYILGLFFIATISLAQFVQPTGIPSTSGTNAAPALDVSATAQVKEGDLGVKQFTGTNSLCMGLCISLLWPVGPLASTCKLEVKRWRNFGGPTPGIFDYNRTYGKGTSCDDLLTEPARAAGWVATSHDSCYISLPDGQSNNSGCEGQHQCHFTRIVCTGSVVMKTPTTAYFMDSASKFAQNFDEFPLTGGMTGDSYPYFMRRPQCNDGIDQPNPDADVLVDYPADLQCSNYADDDETN